MEDSVGKVSRCLNDLMFKENAELEVDNTTTTSSVVMLFVLFPDALGLRTGFCGCP